MGAEVPSLSGAVVLRNLASFRRNVGEDAVARGFASLPKDQRERMEAAVTAAWLDARDVDALYQAIADAAEIDLLKLYPTIVREGVESTLRTVWRVLLRITTPKGLLQRAPIVYRRSHSVGEIATDVFAPGRARVDLTGWPGMSDLRRIGVATGIETLLSVAGRKEPKVTFEGTEDGAVFDLRWTV